MKLCVTGGAGFIGSNFVELVQRERPDYSVTVLDKLTYAGRRDNVPEGVGFVQGDICDTQAVAQATVGCDAIVNFAAESHVDRSLLGAGDFVQTDVFGVYVLLEAARTEGAKFLQVSTDEVYGDVETGHSVETDGLAPRSPYAASKAGGELLAHSYFISHGLPVIITRGSNTFGPRQYPEKLMPLFITNALQGLPLPLYGDGQQKRDWLYVEDHARGILHALENGEAGEAYNIGGGNERTNREVTTAILESLGLDDSLLRHVADRPGHDRRYALNSGKLKAMGWKPRDDWNAAIAETTAWYRDNEAWWRSIRDDAEYQSFYKANYAARLKS
jgi:dTDP-glucose 4,6-dehydratase